MSGRTAGPRPPLLIAFAGLPGSGKSSLARRLAAERAAAYLRIDSIEQALRESGMLANEVGPAGYVAAYALALDNLRLGLDVVADSVNPLPVTRAAWRETAAAAGAELLEVEIHCSDPAEHRRRIEGRRSDIAGLVQPRWEQVLARDYAPWDRSRIRLDTAGCTIVRSLQELRRRIAACDLSDA